MWPSAFGSDRLCRHFCICGGITYLEVEAAETQQVLFSWVGCMAKESAKPKGGSRKPQNASMSMFKWAVYFYQEWQKEPAGVEC